MSSRYLRMVDYDLVPGVAAEGEGTFVQLERAA
jgi:hypothetical protein